MENDFLSPPASEGSRTDTPDPFAARQEELSDPLAEEMPQGGLRAADVGSQEQLLSMERLLGEMQRLHREFETKIKYDEIKNQQIKELHAEVQELREGLHLRILRPVFLDLIALYDDLGKVAEKYHADESDPTGARMGQMLASFQATVAEILERYSVESFAVLEDSFTPERQRALKVVETAEPEQDRKIARRLRPGFIYEKTRVLRPEWVEVYKHGDR